MVVQTVISMSKLFVIGNGESRKNFDLWGIKYHGKVYGCNGLHRDFTPHALISVDPGIMHEVYDKRYAIENTCYFRGWTSIPEMMYDDMVNTHVLDMKGKFGEEPKIFESLKPEGSHEFVIHGTAALMHDELLKENREYKGLGSNVLFISWLYPNDKVKSIDEHMKESYDVGYSAGPTALNIGCHVEKPKQVFLIGCDIFSNTGKYNNVYKDTLHYEGHTMGAVPTDNWLEQYKSNFMIFSDIEFYKVNEKPLGSDNINSEIDEWFDCMNVSYITQDELINKYLTK